MLRDVARRAKTPLLRVSFVVAVALLPSCTSSTKSPPSLGTGPSPLPLGLTCQASAPSVVAGSGQTVLVLVTARRGSTPAVGETVHFTTTLGTIEPAADVTDSSGVATASFRSDVAGSATVSASVTSRIDQTKAGSSCALTVTEAVSRLPLAVVVVSPANLAGLNIRVTFDRNVVRLSPGSAVAAGAFASPSCIAAANESTPGQVLLNLACSSLVPVGNTVVARFEFLPTGVGAPGLEAFSLQCTGVDEHGATVVTSCADRLE